MWTKRFIAIVMSLMCLITYIVYAENTTDEQLAATNRTYEKIIAITFDDGPSAAYTPILLDGLKKRGVRASFFLVGENITGNEEVVRRMHDEGHIIGNHTYSHVELTKLSKERRTEEISKTNELIYSITGEAVKYIRPPCGSFSENLLYEINMEPVLWDVDPMDWNRHDVSGIVESVINSVEDGDIILFHDIYDTSVTAALEVIDRLQAMGYIFVTIDDIIIE